MYVFANVLVDAIRVIVFWCGDVCLLLGCGYDVSHSTYMCYSLLACIVIKRARKLLNPGILLNECVWLLDGIVFMLVSSREGLHAI